MIRSEQISHLLYYRPKTHNLKKTTQELYDFTSVKVIPQKAKYGGELRGWGKIILIFHF